MFIAIEFDLARAEPTGKTKRIEARTLRAAAAALVTELNIRSDGWHVSPVR